MAFGIFDIIASAFSIYSAIESRSENKRAAKEAQAIAGREAARKRAELDRIRSSQRVAYARAGVKLSGTPTLVIDETQSQGQMDIDIIKARGLQQANAYNAKAVQSGADALIKGARLYSRLYK